MFQWTLENKEWLFSGFGIAVFSAIFWFVRSAVRRNRSGSSIELQNGGGAGGNAEIIEGEGEAFGGRGGRGNAVSSGGSGGDARIVGGRGRVIGGEGGDVITTNTGSTNDR